jgi:glycosyltransferase involved in cell wall biosynthesis
VRIAIDLSSAASGGGVTYARELLPRLAEVPGIDLGPVLVRPPAIDLLPPGLRILPAHGRAAARNAAWRSEAESCDVVFAPTEISLQRYKAPLVLAIRNASLVPWLVQESTVRRKTRFLAQRKLARQSAKWATAHIAVSHFAASLADNLGAPSHSVHVVHHGGPAAVRFVERLPARRFLFVSNLYRYKNVDRMISAFAGLSGDWTLDIVGAAVDLSFRRLLDQLTLRLGLSERVHFLGPLSETALHSAYLASDCFVWPPYAETFGHPLLEAHAFGLPIIAARASSNEEIAGAAAVYFDPFDVDGLRRYLSIAINEGLQTGPLPRHYSWEACAAATVSVLESACAAQR